MKQNRNREGLNYSCEGCSDVHSRLLDNIKIENNAKQKKKGGKDFLKNELQTSELRFECFEEMKTIKEDKKDI